MKKQTLSETLAVKYDPPNSGEREDGQVEGGI